MLIRKNQYNRFLKFYIFSLGINQYHCYLVQHLILFYMRYIVFDRTCTVKSSVFSYFRRLLMSPPEDGIQGEYMAGLQGTKLVFLHIGSVRLITSFFDVIRRHSVGRLHLRSRSQPQLRKTSSSQSFATIAPEDFIFVVVRNHSSGNHHLRCNFIRGLIECRVGHRPRLV